MKISPQMVDLLMTIKSSNNPQQMVLSMLESQANTSPFMNNLFTLAKKQDMAGIEAIAKNALKERGFDFDKEFNSFKNTMKL